MGRVIKISCLLLTQVLILCGCKDPITYNRTPERQVGTRWESEDRSIQFEVMPSYMIDSEETIGDRTVSARRSVQPIPGTMIANGETIEFCIYFWMSSMSICSPEYLDAADFDESGLYEKLQCSFRSDSHFVAEVTSGTYLEEGQKIHFYRTYPE